MLYALSDSGRVFSGKYIMLEDCVTIPMAVRALISLFRQKRLAREEGRIGCQGNLLRNLHTWRLAPNTILSG